MRFFYLGFFLLSQRKQNSKLTFSHPQKLTKKNVLFPVGAAQQAELSKTASSFAETFKQEVKKGLEEVSKQQQQQPPKGGGL